MLGFRATEANLLSVPVYAWGCFLTCTIGFLGDRIGSRSSINLYVHLSTSGSWKNTFPTHRSLFGVGLIAYTILIVSRSPALSYFAVYLAVSWAYSSLLTIKVADKAFISAGPSIPPYVSVIFPLDEIPRHGNTYSPKSQFSSVGG